MLLARMTIVAFTLTFWDGTGAELCGGWCVTGARGGRRAHTTARSFAPPRRRAAENYRIGFCAPHENTLKLKNVSVFR